MYKRRYRSWASWAAALGLIAVSTGCHRHRRDAEDLGSPPQPIPKAVPAAPAVANPAPPREGQTTAAQATHALAVVLASRLHVRKEPRIAPGTVIGTLRCGDIVALEATAGEWYQIKLNPTSGYAYGAFIEVLRPGPRVRLPLCEFSFDPRLKRPETAQGVMAGIQRPVRQLAPSRRATRDRATASAEASASTLPAAMIPTSPAPPTPTPSVSPRPVPPPVPAASVSTPKSASHGSPMPVPSPSPLPASPTAHRSHALPQQITLSQPEYSTADPVPFPHRSHADQYACFKCHHPVTQSGDAVHKATTSDVANVEKNCHRCHRSPRQPSASPGASRATSKDVFHLICRDCHRVSGGPTGCSQCHVR